MLAHELGHNFYMVDNDRNCFKNSNDECWSGGWKKGLMTWMWADGWSPCSSLDFKQAYALLGLGDKKMPGGKQCLQDISGMKFCAVDIKSICNSLFFTKFSYNFT